MLRGYFVLGGPNQNASPLPSFNASYYGNHIGAKGRGNWVLETDLEMQELHIPARDKRVQYFASESVPEFAEQLKHLDSSFGDRPYRDKLYSIQQQFYSTFVGTVNNINVDTHGSLGIVSNREMYFTGLHDMRLSVSYLVWDLNPLGYREILASDPMRYLIYRMPVLEGYSVFIQSEAVCSKWWRWLKTHNSVLHAFNALERRMFGEP